MLRRVAVLLATTLIAACGTVPAAPAERLVGQRLESAAAIDGGLRKAVRTGLALYFDFADNDRDGAVDADEARAAGGSFQELDANRDGRLTHAELFSDRALQTVAVSLHDRAARRFPLTDADGNGKLTLAEVEARFRIEASPFAMPLPEVMATSFARVAGADRQLNEAELRAWHALLFERGYETTFVVS